MRFWAARMRALLKIHAATIDRRGAKRTNFTRFSLAFRARGGNFRQKFLAAQEFQIEGLVEHFQKSFGTFRKSIMDCGEGTRQLRGNDRNPEKIMSLCQWLLPSSPSKGPLGGTLWLPPHIQKGKWIAHRNFSQSLSTSNCCWNWNTYQNKRFWVRKEGRGNCPRRSMRGSWVLIDAKGRVVEGSSYFWGCWFYCVGIPAFQGASPLLDLSQLFHISFEQVPIFWSIHREVFLGSNTAAMQTLNWRLGNARKWLPLWFLREVVSLAPLQRHFR